MAGLAMTRSVPQSFEDREHFPAFKDLPGEHAWDDRYLAGATNRKHWCLLGEIIQAETIGRPRIVAKDFTGNQFTVVFHPDDEDDMPRLLGKFHRGNTIAIMEPLVHVFPDRTLGVRVEDSDEVLIMPLKLQEAFAMSREAVKYTSADEVRHKCHGCDEIKENLGRCGRCGMFRYCSEDCQKKAWNEKDHKTFCKALKDENLRWMMFLDYPNYEGSVSFS